MESNNRVEFLYFSQSELMSALSHRRESSGKVDHKSLLVFMNNNTHLSSKFLKFINIIREINLKTLEILY